MPRRRRIRDDGEFFDMVSRVLRAAGRRAARGDPEHLRELYELDERLHVAMVEAVRGLRESGATWQEIGDVTGTTRQAALMRWSPKLAEREGASATEPAKVERL
jgi:hypothetical protein